jgi:hypothetical protein
LVSRVASPTLFATVSDPDGGNVRGKFQVLRGVRPRVVWEGYSGYVASGGTARVTVGVTLVEGVVYTVRVRANDGRLSSPWSPRIQFRVDLTPPAIVPGVVPKPDQPVVYLEDVPAGGVGVAGAFTFTGNGVADVVRYRYSFNSDSLSESVGLSGGPDGQSLDVPFVPTVAGSQTLRVVSVDPAGWTSPVRLYRIIVRTTGEVGRWRLNEGAGTTAEDASGNGHPLTLVDTTWTTGLLAEFGADPGDRALRLDSTGDVASTSDPVVATDQSFSVMAFVKLDAVTATAAAVSQDGTHSSGFALGYAPCADSPGTCWAFTMATEDSPDGTPVRAVAPVEASVGDWVHLTGIYDATAGRIQVYACVLGTPEEPEPGVPVLGTADHTSTWNATGPLRLGRAADADHLAGVVDLVRVFGGAVGITTIRDACQGGGA